MPPSFVLTYWLVGLALIVALMSIPLATRGAPRSYWCDQLAIGTIVGLGLIAAVCAVATSGLIPDVVTSTI